MYINSYTLAITSLLPMAILVASLILTTRSSMDRDKLSPFECGFDPQSSSRLPFSMRFFLLTILFLVFDIEIVLLIPMISTFFTTLQTPTMLGATILIILILGLLHEWSQGSLEWA